MRRHHLLQEIMTDPYANMTKEQVVEKPPSQATGTGRTGSARPLILRFNTSYAPYLVFIELEATTM